MRRIAQYDMLALRHDRQWEIEGLKCGEVFER